MKKLLILMVAAVASAPSLQAGQAAKDNTKSARNDRMADKENEKNAKKAAKMRAQEEAKRQAPAASAKVQKLHDQRNVLLDKTEDLKVAITRAKSNARRGRDTLSAEEAKQLRLAALQDRKYATPGEADQVTKQLDNDMHDTKRTQRLKKELRDTGAKLTKTNEQLADAKEEERKLHVKAKMYDEKHVREGVKAEDTLRHKQAVRRAKDEVEGRVKIAAHRFSNEEQLRHEKREKVVRPKMGLKSHEVLDNPTAREINRADTMERIRARKAAANADSNKAAAKKQTEKEKRRAQEKAAKKAKYAANKKDDAKPAAPQATKPVSTPAKDTKKVDKKKADKEKAKKQKADKKKADQQQAAQKKADKKKAAQDKKDAKKKSDKTYRLTNDNKDQAPAADKSAKSGRNRMFNNQ